MKKWVLVCFFVMFVVLLMCLDQVVFFGVFYFGGIVLLYLFFGRCVGGVFVVFDCIDYVFGFCSDLVGEQVFDCGFVLCIDIQVVFYLLIVVVSGLFIMRCWGVLCVWYVVVVVQVQ